MLTLIWNIDIKVQSRKNHMKKNPSLYFIILPKKKKKIRDISLKSKDFQKLPRLKIMDQFVWYFRIELIKNIQNNH